MNHRAQWEILQDQLCKNPAGKNIWTQFVAGRNMTYPNAEALPTRHVSALGNHAHMVSVLSNLLTELPFYADERALERFNEEQRGPKDREVFSCKNRLLVTSELINELNRSHADWLDQFADMMALLQLRHYARHAPERILPADRQSDLNHAATKIITLDTALRDRFIATVQDDEEQTADQKMVAFIESVMATTEQLRQTVEHCREHISEESKQPMLDEAPESRELRIHMNAACETLVIPELLEHLDQVRAELTYLTQHPEEELGEPGVTVLSQVRNATPIPRITAAELKSPQAPFVVPINFDRPWYQSIGAHGNPTNDNEPQR